MSTPAELPTSPFHHLEEFVALPRVSGLALSVDGSRLVTSVATLDAEGTKWQTALWEIDPDGVDEARRLTRSAPGESSPVFAPDGSLLFLSKRSDPGAADEAEDPKPFLWSLPATGGEARLVASRAAGIDGVSVAADTGEVVVLASIAPAAADLAADTEWRDARKQAGISAVLHEYCPVRHWDHDLGSAVPHAFWIGELPDDLAADEATWRDLTPDTSVPHGVGESVVVAPSGRLLAYSQRVADGPAGWRDRLVVVDTATAEVRVLADDPDATMESPQFSPDSGRIVFVREQQSTHDDPPDQTLMIVDLASGDTHELTPGFDRWPSAPRFDASGLRCTSSPTTTDITRSSVSFRASLPCDSPRTVRTAISRWLATGRPCMRSDRRSTAHRFRCGSTRSRPNSARWCCSPRVRSERYRGR